MYIKSYLEGTAFDLLFCGITFVMNYKYHDCVTKKVMI